MIALLGALAAASPSPVDAERAFAAMAQTEGQWTAFRAYASPAGTMFVPEVVNAQQWLRDRKDPPVPVMWWPGRSWASCDGTLAVNTGSWVRSGGKRVGYFTTIWERQQDGSWKWLLDHGDELPKPRPVGDAVRVRRAKCIAAKPGNTGWTALQTELPEGAIGRTATLTEAKSQDGSLRWAAKVQPDGSRRITAEIWTGSAYNTVIEDVVKAP